MTAQARSSRPTHSQTGFSLIEITISMVIMLVLAALTVPNILRARMAANEASALNTIRTLQKAETTYAVLYPDKGYTCNMAELGPAPNGEKPSSAHADIVDEQVASGKKSGYKFAISQCNDGSANSGRTSDLPISAYEVDGKPDIFNVTGTHIYCVDQNGQLGTGLGADAGCSIQGSEKQ